MKKIVFKIENLHCNKCALELEEKLKEDEDILDLEVSFMKQKISLELKDNYDQARLRRIIFDFDDEIVILGIEEEFSCSIRGLNEEYQELHLKKALANIEGISGVNIVFATKHLTLHYTKKEGLAEALNLINNYSNCEVVVDIKKKTLQLEGLDCAGCASELAHSIANINNVISANIVFVTQKLFIEYLDDEALLKAIDMCNHFEEVQVVDLTKPQEVKKDYTLLLIILSAISFFITFILGFILEGFMREVVFYIGYGTSYLVVGYPVLIKTVKSILAGRIFDENFLMTIASIGAILISIFSEDNMMMEAGAVMLLYQTGEFLQAKAVNSSRKTISELIELKSETANLLVGDEIKVCKPEDLKLNDVILIKAGEKIPTDAVIIEGEGEIDTKSLTGEALPKFVKPGSEILSGCFNLNATLKAKVTKKFSDSTVAKILDLIENSAANKAKPEQFITKFARVYTPLVCLISFLIIVIGAFSSFFYNGNFSHLTDWVIRGLSVLVISCPCALIISVPLTYFGGIGSCASKGILVKSAAKLDDLTLVDTAIFDKTGTLTQGKFKIVKINSQNVSLIKEIACALEKNSNHPISEAFKIYEVKEEATDVKEITGYGLKGLYKGKEAIVGNAKLLKDQNIKFEEEISIHTILYVSYDHEYLGSILIDDIAKPNLDKFISLLPKYGINNSVILSGDNKNRVEAFAKEHNLKLAKGGLLPNEKLEYAQKLQSKHHTLYIGDGINDAPVMSIVDCSFSMGKLGSDTAVEASDFVLVEDDLMNVLHAKAVAKRTKKIVYQNIIGSISIKVIVMIIGAFGLVPLWLAVFSDVGVMLLAVLNSLRIRLKIDIK